jgi:hypothetical protein
VRRVCHELELGEVRAHRWIGRRARGQLVDKAPGGSPAHGLLAEEEAEILALFDEWGETDRSHRKLVHRGSYLHRVWVSPSSVRRVLFLADKHFRPLPRPGRSARRQFPDWVEYQPNSIWIYDTTHFPAAGMAVLLIEDLVSRKWPTEIVSSEETSFLVSREAARRPGWPDLFGADRPRQPAPIPLQHMLTVVADDQLAAATHPVTLAASVPVFEVGERVSRGRLLFHASWWLAGVTTWEADRRAPGRASAQTGRPRRRESIPP